VGIEPALEKKWKSIRERNLKADARTAILEMTID